MRLPNLNVSDSITSTIRDLDRQRFMLDKQISSGQKITLPEDDGMRLGRVISIDSEKGKLAQYQRNASYASEFLNAGHLNLDNLREVNQRAQEISRVAGSSLNGSAMQTYSKEIDQLIEEALNRVNSKHRGRSLFAGTNLKPEFSNTEIILGKEQKSIFSFNAEMIGEETGDGERRLSQGESVVLLLNGKEFVVEAKTNGLSTSQLSSIFKDLINGTHSESAAGSDSLGEEFNAFVRNSNVLENTNNSNVDLYAGISNSGDLEVFGTVDKSYHASAEYITSWDPNHYYPNQIEAKRNERANSLFVGKTYNELDQTDKDIIDQFIFSDTGIVPNWNALMPYQVGDRIYDPENEKFLEFNAQVKGQFTPQSYAEGVHVFHRGSWLKSVVPANSTDTSDATAIPANPDLLATFDSSKSYLIGDHYLKTNENGAELIYVIDANKEEQLSSWQKYDASGNLIGSPTTNPQAYSEIQASDLELSNWSRSIGVNIQDSLGTSSLSVSHSTNWKRLEVYELGDIIEYDGKFWESKIIDNFNHRPNPDSSLYWKELPSDYNVKREDWDLEVTGVKTQFFYQTLDGRLFESTFEAQQHNQNILSNASNIELVLESNPDLNGDPKEVAIPVTKFEINSSESAGAVSFDPSTQMYTLSAASEDGQVIDGLFIKGSLQRSSSNQTFQQGETVLHEGRYYLVKDPLSTNIDTWESLDSTNPTDDLESVFLLGDALPIQGEESISSLDSPPFNVTQGQYIAHRTIDSDDSTKSVTRYFVALKSMQDVDFTKLEQAEPSEFAEVSAFATKQGADWTGSSEVSYSKGEIVLHDGKYYKCNEDNFNNYRELSLNDGTGATELFLIRPDDSFIPDEDGVQVANSVWEEVEKPLDHVLKFQTEREDSPQVVIKSAGRGGIDAEAKAVIDVHGNIVGLKVTNPGRYFFGRTDETATPPEFTKAQVLLSDGTKLEATILWEEKTNDPGPFKIAGFVLDSPADPVVAPSGPRIGDTFSFATGEKTFLDHRNEKGEIINVTYTGSEKNSESFVGKDSKISSFLEASNGNTAELGDVVNTLIHLRNGLANAKPSEYSQDIEEAEKKLISLEDSIIDKMGQITSNMVRMETVRAHDEDYFMQLDQRISRDIDIDLSEAIMKLTRVSTAYQAAMQVGAQLLNSSLLNYL